MTEKEIEKKAKEHLLYLGYSFWFPPKSKFSQRDIFGVFDFIALKVHQVMFVQLTTIDHISHRRKKINDFFLEHNGGVILPNCFIWAWDKLNYEFRIIDI
jgi:hypothetical protein